MPMRKTLPLKGWKQTHVGCYACCTSANRDEVPPTVILRTQTPSCVFQTRNVRSTLHEMMYSFVELQSKSRMDPACPRSPCKTQGLSLSSDAIQMTPSVPANASKFVSLFANFTRVIETGFAAGYCFEAEAADADGEDGTLRSKM